MSLMMIMERRKKIHSFLRTLWLCGLQGTFVLAIGDCHAMNRLPRSPSQSNLSVGWFYGRILGVELKSEALSGKHE